MNRNMKNKPFNMKKIMQAYESYRRNNSDAESFKQYETLREALNAEICIAEKHARERRIKADDIVHVLSRVENKLGLKKKDMEGIYIHVDYHAQTFSRKYKWKAMSTQFSAVYKNGSWRITEIFRDEVKKPEFGVTLTLTDTVKKAYIESIEHMYI